MSSAALPERPAKRPGVADLQSADRLVMHPAVYVEAELRESMEKRDPSNNIDVLAAEIAVRLCRLAFDFD